MTRTKTSFDGKQRRTSDAGSRTNVSSRQEWCLMWHPRLPNKVPTVPMTIQGREWEGEKRIKVLVLDYNQGSTESRARCPTRFLSFLIKIGTGTGLLNLWTSLIEGSKLATLTKRMQLRYHRRQIRNIFLDISREPKPVLWHHSSSLVHESFPVHLDPVLESYDK